MCLCNNGREPQPKLPATTFKITARTVRGSADANTFSSRMLHVLSADLRLQDELAKLDAEIELG
jgi:hypothetical protein